MCVYIYMYINIYRYDEHCLLSLIEVKVRDGTRTRS